MREFFSFKGVFGTRNLVTMALLLALQFIMSQTQLYFLPNVRMFTLHFLPGAVAAALYGPWAGLVFGLAGDTVSFIAKPTPPYFIGYALSDMVSNFIYACFLYRRRVTIPRVLISQLIILVTVTLGLNFQWQVILFGASGATFFTSWRVLVNLALTFLVYTPLVYALVRMARTAQRRSPLNYQ